MLRSLFSFNGIPGDIHMDLALTVNLTVPFQSNCIQSYLFLINTLPR